MLTLQKICWTPFCWTLFCWTPFCWTPFCWAPFCPPSTRDLYTILVPAKKSLGSLQTLQNKSLHLIYPQREWLVIANAHKAGRLTFIDDRCKFAMLKYAHERSFDVTNLCVTGPNRLRSKKKRLLKTNTPNCRAYEKSFVHRSPILLNNLPEEIKSPNLKSFKTRTKCELKLGNINFPE